MPSMIGLWQCTSWSESWCICTGYKLSLQASSSLYCYSFLFQSSEHYGAFLDKLIQDLIVDCKYVCLSVPCFSEHCVSLTKLLAKNSLVLYIKASVGFLFAEKVRGAFAARKMAMFLQILCIGTDRSQQTVQTKIRLLLKKQSDQGLCCLPFHQHLLDALKVGSCLTMTILSKYCFVLFCVVFE